MRAPQCIVVTLTTATCIAVVLICAFLEDEHSMAPVIMPAKEYPRHQPIRNKVPSIINIESNTFYAFNNKKLRTKPQHSIHSKTQESTTNISSNTPRNVSQFIPVSVLSNASLASRGTWSTVEPQSTTSIASNTSHSVTPSTWTTKREKMVKNRYALRKKLLTESCNQSSGYTGEEEEERKDLLALPKLSYYIKKYRFFGCVPAKAGTSTWKIHFLKMKGYTKPIENPHLNWVHRMLRARQTLNRRQADKVLNSPLFARVISVRHPVSRLISAYNNKFYSGRIHVPDGVTSRFIQYVMKMEGTKFQKGQPVAVTFRQFINLILHQKNQGLENINNHWRPQYSLCYACSVSYDYIVKQETFEEDLQYLIKKLEITEVNVNLKRNVSGKPSNITYEEYFRDLPKDVLREIFLLYRPDFLLFGYELPKFFKDLSPPER